MVSLNLRGVLTTCFVLGALALGYHLLMRGTAPKTNTTIATHDQALALAKEEIERVCGKEYAYTVDSVTFDDGYWLVAYVGRPRYFGNFGCVKVTSKGEVTLFYGE